MTREMITIILLLTSAPKLTVMGKLAIIIDYRAVCVADSRVRQYYKCPW